MPINIIDIADYSDRMIHNSTVDFVKSIITPTIYLMQYDNNLPILAVKLMKNGNDYSLPADAIATIRWGKKDHTFIIKEPIGCDATRQILYFEIDRNMAYFYGPHSPIIEVKIGDYVSGSSYIPIEINRNPVQEGDIESSSEYLDLEKAVQDARDAAHEAESAIQDIEALVDHAAELVAEAAREEVAKARVDLEEAAMSEVTKAQEEVAKAINTFEIGEEGQTTPSDTLIVGGIFYEKI